MKALWLENRQLTLRENLPTPAQTNEALVKIRLAGICGTDLEMVKGYYPFSGVPGHEFVGEVIANAPAEWLGRRVVGEINAVCGQCEACQNGRRNHCENRSVLGILRRDGIFAEYAALPLENLHLVPDSVSDEMAVFTEPLAAALEIQQQLQIRPTDRILLIGAGRLGQLIGQTLALTGCDLRVVARHPLQQNLLTGRGIRLIDKSEIQPRRWDVVVEATGSPSGFELARQALRPRGTLVLKSTYRGELTLNLSPFVVDEITVIGSRCGPFAPALRLMEKREIDPTILIAAQYPLEQALRAFEIAAQPGTLKVLLRP